MSKSNKILFCFDFDNTIVNGHFHNHLAGLGIPNKQASSQKIQEMLATYDILNSKELLKTIRLILKQGHYLAITTWGEYPEVITPTLKKLGLNQKEIKQVHIESGIPINQNLCKSDHIKRAKKHFKITNNTNVFLIDDDEKNIAQAIKEGQHGIHVKSPKTSIDYLERIQIFIKELQQENKQDHETSQHQKIKPLFSSFKTSLKAVLFAGCVGVTLGYLGAPLILSGFFFLTALGGLYWHRKKICEVQASLLKNEKKWMKKNASAYDLGYQSKDWLPYVKSCFQPQAYWRTTAYNIGLEEALANRSKRKKK